MSVTLDVSRLSGWLNADASCGVDRRALEAGGVWAKTREGLGRPRRMQQRAGEGPNGDQWGSARAERTINIYFMVMTLDVSRLSGWLNEDAPCRVKKRAYQAGSWEVGEGCGRQQRMQQRASEGPNGDQ